MSTSQISASAPCIYSSHHLQDAQLLSASCHIPLSFLKLSPSFMRRHQRFSSPADQHRGAPEAPLKTGTRRDKKPAAEQQQSVNSLPRALKTSRGQCLFTVMILFSSCSASSNWNCTELSKELSWWEQRQARNRAKGQGSSSALSAPGTAVLQVLLQTTPEHPGMISGSVCHTAGTVTKGAEELEQATGLSLLS